MKRQILLLILFFGIHFSYSQTDCLQADGTFRYEAILYLENIPQDFDKASFLNYIDAVDVLSANDLMTLSAEIAEVYESIPSQPSSKRITIVASAGIYSLLDSFNNSIEYLYCVGGECEVYSDGSSKYNAVLNMNVVPNDFDKDAFFDYITNLDNIPANELSTLQISITAVYKSYPTAQTPFLQKIISIESTTQIFSTLTNLTNSFEYFACEPEPIPLNINKNNTHRKSSVFPNPITQNSILKLDSNYNNAKIEIVNSLGQVIYHENISGNNSIELKNIPVGNGIYFLRISDLINGTVEIIKIIKL